MTHDYDAIIYRATDGTYSIKDDQDNVVSSGNSEFGNTMNNALSFLPSTGGKIVIKSGYFNTTNPINTINKPVIIQGSGPATKISFNGDNTPTLFSMGDTTQRQVFMRDMQIVSSTLSGTAINASYFVKSKLENLTIVANKGIVFNQIGSYYNIIDNCHISVGGVGSVGLVFDNVSNSNTVIGGKIAALDNNPTGVYVNSHNIRMVGIDVESGSKVPLFGIDVGPAGHECNLSSPYLEACDTNIRVGSGVIGFNVFGGFIADGKTKNYTNNGAINPYCWNARLQYQQYTGPLT